MAKIPYSVSVVLDREFGPRILGLLEEGPVWIVDSHINRDSAQKVWAQFPERNHLDGVTVFRSSGDSDPVRAFIDEIPTIDEHHGVYSADPAYTVIRVIGCELKREIQEALAVFGFNFFTPTSEGFEASRPLPPSLGA